MYADFQDLQYGRLRLSCSPWSSFATSGEKYANCGLFCMPFFRIRRLIFNKGLIKSFQEADASISQTERTQALSYLPGIYHIF